MPYVHFFSVMEKNKTHKQKDFLLMRSNLDSTFSAAEEGNTSYDMLIVPTVWTELSLLLRRTRLFPKEIVKAGAVATQRVIWGHEPVEKHKNCRVLHPLVQLCCKLQILFLENSPRKENVVSHRLIQKNRLTCHSQRST